MTFQEAEREALRLTTGRVTLGYERMHFNGLNGQWMDITCTIWVHDTRHLIKEPNWDTAIMQLRNSMHVNMLQPSPDEEPGMLELPTAQEAAA